MKVERNRVFVGTECKCIVYPTVASSYFIGYGFKKEELGQEIFIKVGEDDYLKLKDIKDTNFSRLAFRKLRRYSTRVRTAGDLYIEDIKPCFTVENASEKVNLEDLDCQESQHVL